jgi:hypothetical protein
MTSVRLDSPADPRRAAPSRTSQATVFGLDVRADTELPVLAGSRARSTGRRLDVSLCGSSEDVSFPHGAEVLSEQPDARGGLCVRIEQDRRAGFLLWGPRHGAHRLSSDGHRLRCSSRGASLEAMQRLLVGQVLPFAAVLRGLEVLHASAVVFDGRALAVVAASGAGKSSLALELCERGARFLADDVLVIERRGATLLAHPGTPLVALEPRAARAVNVPGCDTDEQALAVDGEELLVPIAGACGPARLGSLFFLARHPHGPARPRFERVTDPRALLASTFNFVLRDPARLHGLLEVCALLSQMRVERVHVSASTSPSAVAERVVERLRRER